MARPKIEQTEGIATPEELHARHDDALGRELAGRLNRKAELEAMNAHPDALAEVDGEIAAVRAAIKQHASTKPKGERRPRKAAESRAKTSSKRKPKAKR
jgi:hypothetical protein